MSKRVVAVGAVVLAVAGIVLMWAQLGVVGTAIGATLFGVGGVLLMALAFYLVGESEDRDRAKRDGPQGGR